MLQSTQVAPADHRKALSPETTTLSPHLVGGHSRGRSLVTGRASVVSRNRHVPQIVEVEHPKRVPSGRFRTTGLMFLPSHVSLIAFLTIALLIGAEAIRAEEPQLRPMYLRAFQVKGSKALSSAEIGEVVYPFLGPGRLPSDVDRARAALEKAYHDKGYQAVSVQIPVQQIKRGVVVLEVAENPVGRLRVKGARYTSPSALKKLAPSMKEGEIIDFNQVQRDIVALNRLSGREVKPELRQGVVPGTYDIDLQVKEELPFHGSLELNNRYSPNTSELRLNGSLSYSNLWQMGHGLGFNFQIAPEDLEDAQVYSGYYIAPIPAIEGLSLMLQGTKQDSNVSTLGGLAVAGRGEIVGLRLLKDLPPGNGFYQSLSFGLDYKHFDEDLTAGTSTVATPITYYPFNLLYTAGWKGEDSTTEFNGGVTFHLRGMGSSSTEFDNKRSGADGGFIYFRGDLSHTHDLPHGLQAFAKLQGQASSQPLINSEQIAGGGLGNVRGYLESEALGDDGVFATLELRSPSLLGKGAEDSQDDWRVYAFVEGGLLSLQNPLPGQDSGSTLASVGVGTRGRLFNHFNGSVDAGLPVVRRDSGLPLSLSYTFRLWGDF